MTNTITNLINNAAESTSVVAPTRVTRNPMKKLFSTSKGIINSTLTVVDETVVIFDDIVSTVPTMIQGGKEVVTLTGTLVTTVSKRVIFTEKEMELYDNLTPAQRKTFRPELVKKLGNDIVNALEDAFKEEA
jgi:phosphoribosylpyrophosphate synthetase